MSLLSKIKKAVIKGSKYLPGLAAAVPSSKALQTAAASLQTTAGILQGGSIPGIGGPIPVGKTPDISIGGSMPMLPALPGGGGIVKTSLPAAGAIIAGGVALARTQAPAIIAGGRALLARVSPKVAKALGWITVGGLVYDAAGNLQGAVKRRQMNPLNPRAARRAIRRVTAVRKLASKIERQLPKRNCKRR